MSVQKLMKNISSINLADSLKDEDRVSLARQVCNGYDIDDSSRTDWKEKTEAGLKIAKQITEKKTYPWDGAANVKYPIIAIAAIQFAARAYPEIVRGNDVVKAFVVGADPTGEKQERAKRISQHMSWQCMEQIKEWEEDTDTLLHGLPVTGTYFRKSYFDPLLKRIKKTLINPLHLVVNQNVDTLDTARRITHELYLYKNEVKEYELSKIYSEGCSDNMLDEEEKNQELFLEQCCWYDMDGDGYEEPYIVTVHYDSQTLCRVVAGYTEEGIIADDNEKLIRIEPEQYYTKYSFIPDPEGLFYSLGFAHLLGPINETMNTIINQLLDAGHLANMQAGFIGRGVHWRGGMLKFKPGEWKPIDVPGGILKDSIVPLPTKDPSSVLFQLLGMLEEVSMRVSSVSEAMAGESPNSNVPATTTLAMIEQGLKVFTAIYKRIYRSLKNEFRIQFNLNSRYMDPEEYFMVLDVQNKVAADDYKSGDYDVIPAAEPTLSSEAQRLAKVQALMQTIEINPLPEARFAILKRYYDALEIPNVEELLPPESIKKMLTAPPPPNPEVLRLELETANSQHEEQRKRAQLQMDIEKMRAQIEEIDSRTAKNLVEAQNLTSEPELKRLQQEIEGYKAHQQALNQAMKEVTPHGEPGPTTPRDVPEPKQGGSPGMAEQPFDQGNIQVPQEGTGELLQPTGDGGDLEQQLSGSNGDADYAAVGQNLRDRLDT